MFHCPQCNREYGGIRGVTLDRCPRCRDADIAVTDLRSLTRASDRTVVAVGGAGRDYFADSLEAVLAQSR